MAFCDYDKILTFKTLNKHWIGICGHIASYSILLCLSSISRCHQIHQNNQKSFPLEVFIIESHPLSLVQVWKSLVYLYWIRNQNIQYHPKVFSFLSLGTYKLTPIISDVFFRLVILVPLITPYTLSSHNEIKINLPNLNDMSEMMSIYSLSCFFNPLNQIKLKTIVVLDQMWSVYFFHGYQIIL